MIINSTRRRLVAAEEVNNCWVTLIGTARASAERGQSKQLPLLVELELLPAVLVFVIVGSTVDVLRLLEMI